jgi:transcriptional regulator with XRE-family HTH domain
MDILKELRKNKKSTQKEVADYCGINFQTYGRYEKGQYSPDSVTLGKLAEYFGVSADLLLCQYKLSSSSHSNVNYPTTKVSDDFAIDAQVAVNRIISDIQLLARFPMNNNYSYTVDQIEQIFSAIDAQLLLAKTVFKESPPRVNNLFIFRAIDKDTLE